MKEYQLSCLLVVALEAQLEQRHTGNRWSMELRSWKADRQIDHSDVQQNMASVAPFGRRQWASQSLRVTAKELSIVSTRGKNTAIAERFSKYQMAAEEGNAEKKKAVAEALPSTLRSGNLSVLKKRWEQQQQQQQQPPSSSHRSQTQATPCSYTNPTPTPRSQLSLDQDAEPETQVHSEITESTSNQLQSAHPEDLTDMEARPGRDSEGKEGTAAAAEVPDCEKPSVPLNSLKMMFEKGENLTDKVSRESGRSAGQFLWKQKSVPPCTLDMLPAAVKGRPVCRLKTVYPLERLVANQHVYHSSCFRCSLQHQAQFELRLPAQQRLLQAALLPALQGKGNSARALATRPHRSCGRAKPGGETSPQSTETKPRSRATWASDLERPQSPGRLAPGGGGPRVGHSNHRGDLLVNPSSQVAEEDSPPHPPSRPERPLPARKTPPEGAQLPFTLARDKLHCSRGQKTP
ncbi:LIM domain and actin-binding protein 1-like isoform X2 [Lates japonicus]|uniref:LIM domain and actin-binding protein 1-like isoform X2 n=1 Tax=Lates japonicus TaxID=270547 RepID=A0AAD3RKI4_LATJO|nr:LIM domain and actin-binding protein 1-like isoform X2 [Lates japonicus]